MPKKTPYNPKRTQSTGRRGSKNSPSAGAWSKTVGQFRAALQAGEASPLTVKNYLVDLSDFTQWFEESNGEPLILLAITPTDVREYKRHLLVVAKAQPATINRHLAALRKLCRWARLSHLLDDDPTEGVKGVKKVKTAPRVLSEKELDALRRTIERYGKIRDRAIFAVLRNTGVRVGELANLRLADVTLSERKGNLIVRRGKGGKWREIALNPDVRPILRAYLEARPKGSDDHLFIGQRGNGMTAAGIEDVIKKYSRLTNLEDVTPHTLRHSFGKSLLDSGVNLVTVASLLGHSRLDTTAIYTQPTKLDQEKAVDRIAVSET